MTCVQGTPYFMSTEVEAHQYLYLKHDTMDEDVSNIDYDWLFKTHDEELRSSKIATHLPPVKPQHSVIPFRHNGLHDIESLLWVALYILLACTLIEPEAKEELQVYSQYMKAQRNLAFHVFCNSAFRLRLTCGNSHDLLDASKSLHPRVCEVLVALDKLRERIVAMYKRAEADLLEEPHVPNLSKLSQYFYIVKAELLDISTQLKNCDIKIAGFKSL
jgi:hypothetical protein